MTDHDTYDPLSVLRGPDRPTDPDQAFAASLRERLVRALLPTSGELMTTQQPARPRNGVRAGDISYITLGVPDLDKARAFYGPLLGWEFKPGHSSQGAQVVDCAPMVGLFASGSPDSSPPGARLGYRVDDIAAAVAAVREQGGTATDPAQRPYGLESECSDTSGLLFWLHELAAEDGEPDWRGGHWSAFGQRQGDISYVTLGVPDRTRAEAFYGAVLGWSFTDGNPADTTPMMGMWAGPLADFPDNRGGYGAVLVHSVDDLTAAVSFVREAGGQAGEPEQRPYALQSHCTDDQGIEFYLHQY